MRTGRHGGDASHWRRRAVIASVGALAAAAVGAGAAEASGHGLPWSGSRASSTRSAGATAWPTSSSHRDPWRHRHSGSATSRPAAPTATDDDPEDGDDPTEDAPTTSAPTTQPAPTTSTTGSTSTSTTTRTTTPTTSSAGGTGGTGGTVQPPTPNAGVDYQIAGGYALPSGVTVVSRDHDDQPAAGAYSICYVNAFQAQPDAASWWKSNHPDLLLASSGGGYVLDKDWNEYLLDISTAAKRTALMDVVGGWIDGCAKKGFQAVEPDNLDSWTRSGGLLTKQQALDFATLLAQRAHKDGLAIAQKNGLDLGSAGKSQAGFDFAVAEDCMDYTMDGGRPECAGYVDVFGDHVIVLEYDQSHFQQACTTYGATLSVTRRDRDVSTPGSSAYAFGIC